jgi:asparagine synthase (glutamine-hydrolysing)
VSGLCAVASFDGSPVDLTWLDPMVGAAHYRGTDGVGRWSEPGVALAQQLLSFSGNEPVEPYVDDELVVIADARIDNGPELRSAVELPAQGPDVALIAAAYRRWGSTCPERLLGDFAFIIWDRRSHRLFAARDPFGMRMLAYHRTPRRIVLGTEVKQVLSGPEVPARIDESHVAADLIYHMGRPHWSAYEDVHVLAPGHALEVDAGGLSTWRYWSPDPDHRIVYSRPAEYAEHLRELFIEAVRARLRTPERVGILLSGGVDSGSAASTAAWLLERGGLQAPGIHAATWAFEELSECDERDVARIIVDRYGLGWSEIAADRCGPLTDYPAHGPPLDEPFVGAFQPLLDRGLDACRAAGARVMLSGGAGDLVIGGTGYRHLPLLRHRRLAELRSELREHRAGTGEPWPRLLLENLAWPAARRLPGYLRAVRSGLGGGQPAAADRGDVPPWVSAAFAARTDLAPLLADDDAAPAGFGPSRRDRLAWVSNQLHIRGMAWLDRIHAQHGLAFADPFIDRRVVEFVLAVPQAAITPHASTTKPLMRAAMRGIVPEEARVHASKVLPLPLYERALTVDHAATVRGLLGTMASERRGWVDARPLREAFASACRGAPLPSPFWAALVTEWWLRDHHE